MGQDNANLIEDAIYTLVLRKLKHILVNGFYSMDEVRYEYSWNETRSKAENIHTVSKEDAVLRYFIDMKVIDGERIPNEFRNQELRGNEANKSLGVWANWDEVDPAYREYEWVVRIYGIDTEKLSQEFSKFGLVDAGKELIEKPETINLPEKILDYDDNFSVHQSNIVSYKGRRLALEPQVGRIATFIIDRASRGLYTTMENIIDNCISEDYLSKAEKSSDDQLVYKYIRRCVSDARKTFRAYTESDENKNHFPNVSGTGYTFVP